MKPGGLSVHEALAHPTCQDRSIHAALAYAPASHGSPGGGHATIGASSLHR